MATIKRNPQPLINALRDIITTENIATQEALQHALKNRRISATQSSISRALHQLGANKGKNSAGDLVYQLPQDAPATLHNKLSSLIVQISHNETLILIHTAPGSASLVARSLDLQGKTHGILGTIAGDDTIVVIPQSIKKIDNVLHYIKQFLLSS